jgi:hypothetical protein
LITNLLGFLQLLLGAYGLWGIYLYAVEPTTNHSRYQFLYAPAWTFVFALPLLLIAAFLYRKAKAEMTTLERYLFNVGCALPLIALAAAISI